MLCGKTAFWWRIPKPAPDIASLIAYIHTPKINLCRRKSEQSWLSSFDDRGGVERVSMMPRQE